jgi:hypothetical protein
MTFEPLVTFAPEKKRYGPLTGNVRSLPDLCPVSELHKAYDNLPEVAQRGF